MTDEILIAGLKRKYAELAGELRQAHKTAHDLKHSMATVKATLKLFDAEAALAGVKPIAPPLAGTWFRHGQCSRAVLDVLRTATAPMTVREIAEAVMAVCELPKGDRTAFVAAREGVRYALRQHRSLVVEDGCTPKRMALAR